MQAKDLLPPSIELDDQCDPQVDATAELEELAFHLDLESWIVNKLRHCEREVTVNLPIVRDDGTAATFTGLRAQHISWRGPSVGPIAVWPTAQISELRAIGMEATWQAALLNLPFGGAAGAIVCDPQHLSERELRQISKDYVYALRGMLGHYSDVLTPGPGSNEQIMAWMLDSHAHAQGHMEAGAITGLPLALSGLPGTAPPIARGVTAIVRHLLARRHATLDGQRISIQGFGRAGCSIARGLHDCGARVVALADVSGALHNVQGIDVPTLQEYLATKDLVFGFPEAEPACNADIIEADCDILVTAATEGQITAANAHRITASIVVEATRHAITRAAEAILTQRGVVIVPEILATAGAAVSAFLEWNQAEHPCSLSSEEVDRELDNRIIAACNTLFEIAVNKNLSTRRAAHLAALGRLASEMRLRN